MDLQQFAVGTLILTRGMAIAFYFVTVGGLPSKYCYMMAVDFGCVINGYPKDNSNVGLYQKKAMWQLILINLVGCYSKYKARLLYAAKQFTFTVLSACW